MVLLTTEVASGRKLVSVSAVTFEATHTPCRMHMPRVILIVTWSKPLLYSFASECYSLRFAYPELTLRKVRLRPRNIALQSHDSPHLTGLFSPF